MHPLCGVGRFDNNLLGGWGVSKIGAQFGGRVLSPGFHCHFRVGGKFSTSL